jgi:hypothetical protein
MTHIERLMALETDEQRERYVYNLSPEEGAELVKEWNDAVKPIVEAWESILRSIEEVEE